MDIVITYVNQEDNFWKDQVLKYNPTLNLSKSHRYKDYGTLPYLLRGIEKYMPFINNVFLVVAYESQVPNWINRDQVRVIYHKDIIPVQFLPTFNSCTIEMFLHNIPGLDEEFIYFNDDMFPIHELQPEDFFINGKPVTHIKEQPRSNLKMFHKQLYNTTQAVCKLLNINKENIQLRAEHGTSAMLKSVNKYLYERLANKINLSISPFRTENNITQYLSLYYNYLTNNYVDRTVPILQYFNTHDTNTLSYIEAVDAKIICLNDNGPATATWETDIIKLFNKMLPKVSKYEIDDSIKVDYVIPFVDFSDDIWYEVYEKHVDKTKGWNNNSTRFRDWDVLKYQLRSIEKNMPWINNIYIIISITPTQVPKWLNTNNDKIHIVMDSDIIPPEYLPTFNSNTVDLFIPNIKGLADHYIYACDDYVITKPLSYSDFYTNDDKVKQYISIFYMNPNHPYTQTIVNSNNFVNGANELKQKTIKQLKIQNKPGKILGYKSNHGLVPHLLQENKMYLRSHYHDICNTLSMFRSEINTTWLIYTLNLLVNNKLQKDKHVKTQKNNVKDYNGLLNIDTENYDVIVINDDYKDDFEAGRQYVNKLLTKKFPKKSQFEI